MRWIMIHDRRERSDMLRLFFWGLLAIILYLTLSFKPVYGTPLWGHFDYSGLVNNIEVHDNSTESGPVSLMTSDGIITWGSNLDLSGGNFITGNYPPDDRYHDFDPADNPDSVPGIPEPATLLFFGIGFAGAGIYRTLRR